MKLAQQTACNINHTIAEGICNSNAHFVTNIVIIEPTIYNWNDYICENNTMERIVNLHIEKLPEGFYLATSDNVQGLIAQGRTIAETIEIAKDIAKKLLEAQEDKMLELVQFADSFDYPLIVGI